MTLAMRFVASALLLLLGDASGLLVQSSAARGAAPSTRRQALQAAGAAFLLPLAPFAATADEEPLAAVAEAPAPVVEAPPPPPPAPKGPTATKNGVGIKVLKTGKGGQPAVGDLIAIKFKGSVTASGQVFDDIMENPEPYSSTPGSTFSLPGVEEAVKMMHTGDLWELAVPGKYGFGEKGRSASPGKPRIPSNADLTFLVELIAVPGKDDEILEVTGGSD